MSATTLKQKEVITRKPHECHTCGRMFPAGTHMLTWTNVDDDGEFYTGYQCKTCEKLINKYRNLFADACEECDNLCVHYGMYEDYAKLMKKHGYDLDEGKEPTPEALLEILEEEVQK